jgi:ADP-ribosylglycohydrolase
MLGAVIGDIVGSVFEHSGSKAKDFPLFAAGSTFTDDTVCTIAVADALLRGVPAATALRSWCRRYPGRGYGASFAAWLASPAPRPYGSFGNGAAMRVSPAGLLARTLEEALALARRVTEVTHDHPEGLKGACATAHAIWLARRATPPGAIRRAIAAAYGYDLGPTVEEIRPFYRYDISCQGSVPPALVCALEARDYEDAIRNAVSLGGDADTLAAIAGGVAEALFGVPEPIAREGLARLPPEMVETLARLYAAAGEESAARRMRAG